MHNVEILVSVETINRVFMILAYLPIGWISFWRLIPRITISAKRLAGAMLLAQVLVILWSMEWQPSSNFEHWLQLLTGEYNVPATLASVQLALVGCVALATARLAKGSPVYQRFYNIGIGLTFLFLALDEYHKLHERIPNWAAYYSTLGAVVVLATTVVAAYSPRRDRIWHFCLLAGLAISATGAIGLEFLPTICGSVGPFRLNQCLLFSTIEEALEFLGIWLVLVAVLGRYSDVAPTPSRLVQRTLYAVPVLWMILLLLISLIPLLEIRFLAQPASVVFQSGLRLHGYIIDSTTEAAHIRLYASARQGSSIRMGYSTHLVDQVSGDSVARREEWEDRQNGFWIFGPEYAPVYGQWMELDIPPQTPANRAFWLVLSLWRKRGDDYLRQAVRFSDLELLTESQVVLGELVIPSVSTATQTVPLAVFDNGFALSVVDLPERAQAGEILKIAFTWRTDVAGQEDIVQYLHLGHVSPPRDGGSVEGGAESVESGEWFVYDHQPLGPRLPTRLWYSGLADSETWQVPLPADLAPGRYNVFTGLYRARDQERIPASGAEGTPWLDARVRLGVLTIGNT